MALNFNPSFSGSIIDFDALRDYNDKKKEQEYAMRQAKNASRAKTLEVLGKDIENYIGQQNRIKEGKTFDTEFSKMTPEEQAKFGWISSPEYTEARSVYERTGDPTALNNLRSTWQAQQNADRQFKLQQDQIAAQKEEMKNEILKQQAEAKLKEITDKASTEYGEYRSEAMYLAKKKKKTDEDLEKLKELGKLMAGQKFQELGVYDPQDYGLILEYAEDAAKEIKTNRQNNDRTATNNGVTFK